MRINVYKLQFNGYYTAEVEGHPEFGSSWGDTPEQAKRSMEIFLEDNRSSIEVVKAI